MFRRLFRSPKFNSATTVLWLVVYTALVVFFFVDGMRLLMTLKYCEAALSFLVCLGLSVGTVASYINWQIKKIQREMYKRIGQSDAM